MQGTVDGEGLEKLAKASLMGPSCLGPLFILICSYIGFLLAIYHVYADAGTQAIWWG